MTVHCSRAWTWYESAHGSDKTGPLAGVPYDGVLTKADGKGKWWEGLDPADLYCPHGAARTPAAQQAYKDKFFNRVKDLVDSYRPDLLYFDDTVPPLGDAGMNVVAHFLNANRSGITGRWKPSSTRRSTTLSRRKTYTNAWWTISRAAAPTASNPTPGRPTPASATGIISAASSIAPWRTSVKELVDIVSKNGNMLLNIPVRGNGTIDEDEMKFLEGLTKWMDVNSESIYGTRPWRVYGEGETDSAGKFVNNGREHPFAGSDIRFVQEGRRPVRDVSGLARPTGDGPVAGPVRDQRQGDQGQPAGPPG